jgi:predicted flavoprotein YhiN
MEKRPFSKKTLNEFQFTKVKSSTSSSNNSLLKVNAIASNNLIASPNLSSKFSPSVTISKSPTMNKRVLDVKSDSTSILNKYSKNPSTNDKKAIIDKIEDLKLKIQLKQPIKKNRINLIEDKGKKSEKELIVEQQKYD